MFFPQTQCCLLAAMAWKSGDHDVVISIRLIGDTGVGKTSLIRRFVDDTFEINSLSSYVNCFTQTIIVNEKRVKLEISEGLELSRDVHPYALRSDGLMLIYDVMEMESEAKIEQWYYNRDVWKIFLGNKCDLLASEDGDRVFEIAQVYANDRGILNLKTSAKKGTNVNKAFYIAAKEITLKSTQPIIDSKVIKIKATANSRALLLHDSKGFTLKFSLRKFISGGETPHKILCGELLTKLTKKKGRFNYQLFRDPTIYMSCKSKDVYLLSKDEFLLLQAAQNQDEIMSIFKHKLEWGRQLNVGSVVWARLPQNNCYNVKAYVHYKGAIGDLPGTNFGVEIMTKEYCSGKFGTTNGFYEGKQYFSCKDGCGLIVSLSDIYMSPGHVEPIQERKYDAHMKKCSESLSLAEKKQSDSDSGSSSFNTTHTPSLDESDRVLSLAIGQKPLFDETLNEMLLDDKADWEFITTQSLASKETNESHDIMISAKASASSSPVIHEVKTTPDKEKLEENVEISTLETTSEVDAPADVQLQQALSCCEDLKMVIKGSIKKLHNEKEIFSKQEQKFQAQMMELKDSLQLANSAIQEKEDAIQNATKIIHESQATIGHHLQEIMKLRDEVQSNESNQQKQQRQIVDLKSDLLYSQNEVTNLIAASESNASSMQSLLLMLKENEILVEAMDREIAAKNSEISRQESEITNVTRTFSEEISAKDIEIARKDDEIAELEQALEAEKNADLLEIQKQSTSWNITRAEVQNLTKKQIGVGAWGIVYSAKFRGENVAIKQAHQQLLHQATVDMLKREVMIMAHIKHPNLVRFIAAVLDEAVEKGADTPIIVSELMDMNLRDAYARIDIVEQQISIFCDVAYALHYLHQHRPSIIHRDVSAPNVLLKALPHGTFKAKVSDFGSANLVKQSKTAGAGAIVYCAPEMFPSEDFTQPPQPQTTKVDVFSYGVLLLEVGVREMPTPESRYALLQRLKEQSDVTYKLIIDCTRPLPSERPAMATVLDTLNRIH